MFDLADDAPDLLAVLNGLLQHANPMVTQVLRNICHGDAIALLVPAGDDVNLVCQQRPMVGQVRQKSASKLAPWSNERALRSQSLNEDIVLLDVSL